MSAGDEVEKLGILLRSLTGEDLPFGDKLKGVKIRFGHGDDALGYSQLNELLLLAGLDRINHAFFAFLLEGHAYYEWGSGFESIERLEAGIGRFRTLALLLFGNVKFAFKTLAHDSSALVSSLEGLEAVELEEFTTRHLPVLEVEPITPDDAFLTGYIVQQEIAKQLERDPDDEEALTMRHRRKEILERATRNQEAYYASDHLDVYVATSMRARHEFTAISDLTRQIFDHPLLRDLKLRWFDPTQAYCPDRIDKGLAEALMLRRAACTIYLAQVSDTLGKDSELASTLAQGKPVIAYVPEVDEVFIAHHFETLRKAHPERAEAELLLDELRVYEPDAAWRDAIVQRWALSGVPDDEIPALRARVAEKIVRHYDGRASTLRDHHPLGIQVHLRTGVANGVLVVRNPADCAKLVRGILTRTLDLRLEEQERHTVLREAVSGSVFRVMTKDLMLTNSFWNFYLTHSE